MKKTWPILVVDDEEVMSESMAACCDSLKGISLVGVVTSQYWT
jgi:hypothetical protein